MIQAWRGGLRTALCMAFLAVVAGCSSAPRQPAGTTVVIKSDPEGAEVMAGGEQGGIAPATFIFPPGYVDVLLKKDGYKMATDRIEVRPGQPQEFTIAMRPLMGYLSVETTPPGAEVVLDGAESLGKTPFFSKEIPVGARSWEVRLADHYPVQESVTVEEDFKYTKNYVLRPMEATVAITSRPSGAAIFINNERQGQTSPAKFTLRPGSYVISVYASGFVQKEEKIELLPNEERNLSLVMEQGDVPPGMVLIPAGEFVFGADNRAPDEAPRTVINLPAFYIDKTEVTNRQYKEIVTDHKYPPGQDDWPVTGISWNEAVRFASMSGKRLPTEREWEKAARGAEGREYPWGDTYDPALCNGLDLNKEAALRVSQFIGGMSPYGCMDMAGNVYEWTQDWYEAYPGNTQVTKEYGQVFRVLRGGSFKSDRFDVRSARRRFDKMDAKKPEYGFRCAKDVPK